MTKPVTGQTTFGSNTTGTTTQLDNNFLLAYNALNDFNTYSNMLTDVGAANAYAASLPASATGPLTDGLIVQLKVANANTGSSTFAYNGGAPLNILNLDGSAIAAGAMPASAIVQMQYRASDTSWILQTSAMSPPKAGGVRQTVLSGPATNDVPTLIPASCTSLTLSTANISSSAPMIVSASNGWTAAGVLDRVAQATTNITWPTLTANVVNYLGVTIASNGNITAVVTANAPVYQASGTFSNGNNNYTFNYTEMVMKLGNGNAANQTYTVFVGEANCNASAVVAGTTYTYNAQFESGFTATLPGTTTTVSANHNLGVYPLIYYFEAECTTADIGYAVGDRIKDKDMTNIDVGAVTYPLICTVSNKVITTVTGTTNTLQTTSKASGVRSNLTLASWKYHFLAKRGW